MGVMSYPSPLPSVVNRGTPKQTQLNCSPFFPLVANSLNLKMNGKLFSHMLSPESNSSFNPSPVPGTGLTASIALCFICDMPDRQADGQRERPTDTQIANGLPIAYARAQPNSLSHYHPRRCNVRNLCCRLCGAPRTFISPRPRAVFDLVGRQWVIRQQQQQEPPQQEQQISQKCQPTRFTLLALKFDLFLYFSEISC